jgi:hypothetical protein
MPFALAGGTAAGAFCQMVPGVFALDVAAGFQFRLGLAFVQMRLMGMNTLGDVVLVLLFVPCFGNAAAARTPGDFMPRAADHRMGAVAVFLPAGLVRMCHF